MTVLAVFRSRAQALDCISLLRKGGIPVSAVGTPAEAGVGCGISVRFDERFFIRVRSILGGCRYSSFAGFLRRTPYGYERA